MAPRWISTGEAAQMLGYSRTQFWRKFRDKIPHIRIGSGNYRWSQGAIEALIRRSEGVIDGI